MKGYYVWVPFEQACVGTGSGIEKKIRAQVEVFNQNYDTKLVILKRNGYNRIDKYISRMPFGPVGYKWRYHGEMRDAKFIYIRQVQHDAFFLRYLKAIKKANPKVKIIYEIPTYPYENEQNKAVKNLPLVLKDRFYRRKLKKYVDRIVTFYGQEEIWGIKTIKIRNGFEFSTMPVNCKKIDRNIIHLIEVSATAFWHGYDRFLEGLQDYYRTGGKRNIIFHMVGIILPEHRKYVEQNKLSEHVIFHGVLSGKELKEVYEECSAGVDVLGGHRKNYPVSGSLKSREYAACGLPIITASPVDYIEEDYPYQLIVPYDDSPVDIQSVINFVDSCYENKDENWVRGFIREYGYEHCEMNRVMQPVIDFIES